EALGHADRGAIGRPDEADEVVALHRGERVVERAPRALGRVAFAPRGAAQHPAQLEARPALGLEEADAAEEGAGRALLDRPQPDARRRPVAEDQRHLSPGFAARQRLAIPEIPHHLVSAHIAAYASRSSSRNIRRMSRSVSSVIAAGASSIEDPPTRS